MKHTRKNKSDRKKKKMRLRDYTCGNHGKCDYCCGNRLHKFVKPELEAIDDIVEAVRELGLSVPVPVSKNEIPECDRWIP